MKKHLVSFKVAQQLKRVGFKEETLFYYNSEGELMMAGQVSTDVDDIIYYKNAEELNGFAAPLYVDVMLWFSGFLKSVTGKCHYSQLIKDNHIGCENLLNLYEKMVEKQQGIH